MIILSLTCIGRAEVNTQALSLSGWEGGARAPGIAYNGALAIRWDQGKSPSVSTSDIPHDWRAFNCIDFALHSVKQTGDSFMLILSSDKPETEGDDYFSVRITIDWTGWREFVIPLNEFSVSRQPTWSKIDRITFTAEGWGNHPNPEAVIHISDLKLTSTPSPGISDGELFGILNLDYPGLEKVRAALEAGNLVLGKQELADYFRHRQKPVWKFDAHARPKHDSRPDGVNTQDADRFLKHEMYSQSHWQQFGDQIDWHLNPIDYKEWPWQLNRHHAWVILGRAYWDTGEEKYAKEFVAQMTDWVTRCHVPVMSSGNSSYTWRTIETGIRSGQTLPEAYSRFITSPSFTDDAIILMVKSFAEHARHLMKWPSTGNWLAMEANGLMTTGVLFPEFKESAEWRKTATDRLYAELDKQVYPDGAQIELSTGYHQVSLDNFLMAYQIAELNDVPMPADYVAKLGKMWEYNLKASMPDGTLPGLNDAGRINIRITLERAFKYFPDRKDFEWVATGGKEGQKPSFDSVALPFSGHLVMRNGWEPNDLYLLFDAGPFGYGHQHEDALSIVLYAYGKYLVVDPGSYPYDSSQWRNYVLSTRAHNTIMVDGQEQHRRGLPNRADYVLSKPLPNKWASSDDFDYAVGAYTDGYGPENLKVTHTRHIFFVKPEYWVIVDVLTPSDDKPHKYESMFHVDAEGLTVQDGTHRTHTTYTTHEDPNLSIFPLGLSAKIISGQETPTVQGWILKSGYEVRPLPTAVFTKEASGPTVMAYVLYPTAPGSSCPVTGVFPFEVANAYGVAVQFANGRVDCFTQATGPGKTSRKGFESDAFAGYGRQQGQAIEKAILVGGTKITQDGKAIPAELLELKDLSQTKLTHKF